MKSKILIEIHDTYSQLTRVDFNKIILEFNQSRRYDYNDFLTRLTS